MNARLAVKRVAQAIALMTVFPTAVICGFGRVELIYTLFAHVHALTPGFIGNYFRAAFYKLTLQECSIDTTISFGTFFSRRSACVGPFVSIGAFCVIGGARIGSKTQIASHVEIPSGPREHSRGVDGELIGSVENQITIGANCWIGASAIVMANIGDGTTIGAGSVVVNDVPAGVVAVGNPARMVRPMQVEIAR